VTFAPRPSGDALPDATTVESLTSRLVFSLLHAAVRLAARVQLPLDRLTELLRSAYFVEYRRRHPRDLAAIADKLGVSLRTAGTLNRAMNDAFFAPETRVEPIRRVTGALLGASRSPEELVRLTGLEAPEVDRVLVHLTEVGWVDLGEGNVTLSGSFRSHVAEDLGARVDAINHQMSVVADSVHQRFLLGGVATAGARTWSFAARPEQVGEMMDRVFQTLRAEAVALENDAMHDAHPARFGLTVAIAAQPPEER
jgi:hypothetical protein